MKTAATRLPTNAPATVRWFGALVLVAVSASGCLSTELLERAQRVELFESATAPDNYVLMGQVYVAERFPNLRPDEQQVIDKLKLRAAKLGGDAIGNIHIARSGRVRYAGTPRYVELRGAADYYRKRLTE